MTINSKDEHLLLLKYNLKWNPWFIIIIDKIYIKTENIVTYLSN